MNIKHLLPLQRIIGKVDNDFNIDQSDWIPRVAAWVIDAMAQIKCTPMTLRKEKYDVEDRIVYIPRLPSTKNIKVYTTNGCEIDRLSKNSVNIGHVHAHNLIDEPFPKSEWNTKWNEEEIAIFIGDKDAAKRLTMGRLCTDHAKNFVVIDETKLELNYDADYVIVESLTVATYFDEYFNEEVPYVYDNGDLLEALSWYVMMKILQRGYKHQVFSLSGQEPVNPYIQWNKLKDKAYASVRHDLRDPSKNEGWNNFFYNSTFLPRG